MRCGKGRDGGHGLPGRDFSRLSPLSQLQSASRGRAASSLLPGAAREEEVGHVLSPSLQITEATRAATSAGRRRILPSHLLGYSSSRASAKQPRWKRSRTPCLPSRCTRQDLRAPSLQVTPAKALL